MMSLFKKLRRDEEDITSLIYQMIDKTVTAETTFSSRPRMHRRLMKKPENLAESPQESLEDQEDVLPRKIRFPWLNQTLTTNEDADATTSEETQQNESIKCPKCCKTFENRNLLTEHLKTYITDEKTCPICSKVLSSASSRDRHLVTHSKERSYACKYCKSSFTTNGNMNRHMAKHKGSGILSNESAITDDNDREKSQSGEPNDASQSEEKLKDEECQERLLNALELRRKSSKDFPTKRKSYDFRPKPICEKNNAAENKNLMCDGPTIEKENPTQNLDPFLRNASPLPLNLQAAKEAVMVPQKKLLDKRGANSSKTSNNPMQSIPQIKLNSDLNGVHDFAGIPEIISNVQQNSSAENYSRLPSEASTTDTLSPNTSIKKAYRCELCEYSAKDKNSLKRHSQKHNRKACYLCKKCGASFTLKANGERHVREKHGVHNRESVAGCVVFLKEKSDTKDEKFPCKYCPRVFESEQSFQHHLRSNDCKMKPFTCKLCHTGSSTKNNCFRHIENKHPELFTNTMSSEAKTKVKASYMIHVTSPSFCFHQQDEVNTSKEIEAAEGFCFFVETARKHAEQFSNVSSSECSQASPPASDDTSVYVIAETSPLVPEDTSPMVDCESDDSSVNQPLDLSHLPLDLSIKKVKEIDSDLNLVSDNVTAAEPNVQSQSEQNAINISSFQHQKSLFTPKQIRCTKCNKSFSTKSNLRRHLSKKHAVQQVKSFHNPQIRRDHLRESSINSPNTHSGDNQVKNVSSLPRNAKFIASYDRGTGSDVENNDLASIPSIQSTVNQGIHINHSYESVVHPAASLTNRKRCISDVQSCCSSDTPWNKKKFARSRLSTGPRPHTEAACCPFSMQQSSSTPTLATTAGDTSTCDWSKSSQDQTSASRLAEAAELLASTAREIRCRYCPSLFSSIEHIPGHMKVYHYQEYNNTAVTPNEINRWRTERFSKLRQ